MSVRKINKRANSKFYAMKKDVWLLDRLVAQALEHS